jgi:hypothetical protein
MTQDIPDSTYGEFGDVKYIIVPEGSSYQLTMRGQDSSTFSLDMQETSGGIIIASSTIANVPTTENTLASMTISNGIDTASPLTVDENGDGENIVNIAPVVGETVNYSPPPEPEPEPPIVPAQEKKSSHGSSSTSFKAPTLTAIATAVPSAFPTTVKPIPNITETASSTNTNKKPPSVAVHNIVRESSPEPGATSTKGASMIPLTASVYDAVFRQPFFIRWGNVVYNIFYGFWSALKKFF